MADPVQYRWKSVHFAVPAGFVDDSILRFRQGDRVSITVATDGFGGAVDAFAREQETAFRAQLGKTLAGYKADGPRVVDNVVCVDRRFEDDKGAVFQRQAFASGGKGVVVIVTASARPAHQAEAERAVIALVQSLSVAAS